MTDEASPPRPPDPRPSSEGAGAVAVMVAGAIAGLALVASTFLPWPADGAGSTLAAHRLGDLLLSEAAAPWVPGWAGLLVYLVPAGGAVVMVASGLESAAAPWLKLAGLVPAALVSGLAIWVLSKRHPLDLGAGALLAVAGSVLGSVSWWFDRRRRAER